MPLMRDKQNKLFFPVISNRFSLKGVKYKAENHFNKFFDAFNTSSLGMTSHIIWKTFLFCLSVFSFFLICFESKQQNIRIVFSNISSVLSLTLTSFFLFFHLMSAFDYNKPIYSLVTPNGSEYQETKY